MNALSRLLRTTAFALSVFHIGVFAVLGGAMVAWTYWQANDLLTARVLQTINIEADGLRLEVLQSGGAGALKRAILQRSQARMVRDSISSPTRMAGPEDRWQS